VITAALAAEAATPHLRRILAYAPEAMSSLTASLSGLASGDPFAVTKPTGAELNWPTNFTCGMWAAAYTRLRVGPVRAPS
jgi:hypothetical protein